MTMQASPKELSCRICGHRVHGKPLAFHIFTEHGLRAQEYTTDIIYGGKRPLCPECGGETRYSAWRFKTYCVKHSSRAESAGGAKGGRAPAWNRGKTVDSDPRILKSTFVGDKNPFFGRHHDQETLTSIAKAKRLTEAEFLSRVESAPGTWRFIDDFSKYEKRQSTFLLFICDSCGEESRRNLFNIERGASCKNCDAGGKSLQERELFDFVRSLGLNVERNVRYVISPKEVDIWVPSKRVALEYDGLYWHSRDEKDPGAPLEKLRLCQRDGIRLLSFFSDEWRDRRLVVESIIRNALGMTDRRLDARKLDLREVDASVTQPFLNRCHIDGGTRAGRHLALLADGEPVSVMTLRTPHHSRYSDCLEVARFASELGTSVRGGLGRLVGMAQDVVRGLGKSRLLTYVDLRFGTGVGYERVGFVSAGHTGRSYWHTDGHRRFNRFAFRADVSRQMTERQVCEEAGVCQVYGPGNTRMFLTV